MARIRHLAILTEDVDRMVKFYINSFGLKIVKGVGTATYLTDGHINLAIIPIGPEREIEGNQLKEGINHFGFEVDSVADLVPVCQQWGAATDTQKAAAQPGSRIPGSRSRRQSDRPVAARLAALTRRCSEETTCAVSCTLLAASAAGAGLRRATAQTFPVPSGHDGRAVYRRRTDRHARAHRRRADVEAARAKRDR